jgi:replicative DNA helicase
MVICDAGGLTIDDIRVQALRQMRAWDRAGVARGCVLIDHIGLVRPVKKGDSKAADTADIVNELKSLAKAIRAPIIVLSQVNRGPEGRQDKRPTAADLNWSGAIEQIADMICLLYRESYYLERSADRADRDSAVFVENKLELLIQKNRSGPTCNLEAWIDVACNAVRDVSENHTDDRSRSG